MSQICFVIQPFDGAKYDKRFDDVFKPAIAKAGYEPYRVDRDASVSVPVQKIEEGIRTASACLVDVTENNPNVWFELGMALAFRKPVCLVCSVDRGSKYPFDIQHLAIISYKSESSRDFTELGLKITERLSALERLRDNLETINTLPVASPSGELDSFAEGILAICASEISGMTGWISNYFVKNSMESAGYNSLATNIGIRRLIRMNFVQTREGYDQDGVTYDEYCITATGWDWIEKNMGRFDLTASPRQRKQGPLRTLEHFSL